MALDDPFSPFSQDLRALRSYEREAFESAGIGMVRKSRSCVICRGTEGDAELSRVEVWSDAQWRLTTAIPSEIAGFSYLEPRRHMPHITDLDGEEARTLGSTLARTSAALKKAASADLVYVYVFGGGIPHLHIHLAPHRKGDALNDRMIRGELEEKKLPSGATAFVSKEFRLIAEGRLRRVVERTRALLVAR